MKTILQSILMMETNEFPGETSSLGNIEIKCLISLCGEVVHFGLGKKRGCEERLRLLLDKIYLESEFPVV